MIPLRRLFAVVFISALTFAWPSAVLGFGSAAPLPASASASLRALSGAPQDAPRTHGGIDPSDTLAVRAVYADGSEATILTFYGAGRTWTVPPHAMPFERFVFSAPAGARAFRAPSADSTARAEMEAGIAEVMAIPYEGFEAMALEMAAESDGGMMMGPMLRVPDAFPQDERARSRVPLRVAHLRALEAPEGLAEAEGDRLVYAELEKTYDDGDAERCPIRARLPVWFLEGGGGVSILSEHLELTDCADPRPEDSVPVTPRVLFRYDGAWWALATQDAAPRLPEGTASAFVLVRVAGGAAKVVGTAYTNAR